MAIELLWLKFEVLDLYYRLVLARRNARVWKYKPFVFFPSHFVAKSTSSFQASQVETRKIGDENLELLSLGLPLSPITCYWILLRYLEGGVKAEIFLRKCAEEYSTEKKRASKAWNWWWQWFQRYLWKYFVWVIKILVSRWFSHIYPAAIWMYVTHIWQLIYHVFSEVLNI